MSARIHRVLWIGNLSAAAGPTTKWAEKLACSLRHERELRLGLQVAKAHVHDAIVVCLPPETALAALQYLDVHRPDIPVLVVRPSVDEFAFNAGKLGAFRVVEIESLDTGLADALGAGSFDRPGDIPFVPLRTTSGDPQRRRAALVRMLRARVQPEPNASHSTVLRLLASAIVERHLSFVEFLVLGAAFRLERSLSTATPVTAWLRNLDALVSRTVPNDALSGDPRLHQLFELFASARSRCLHLHCAMTAADMGLSAAELRTWLVRHTGCSFLACRRLFVTRGVLLALHRSEEHVAQIAFNAGYPQHHQLDRDVRRFLNVCPSAFRKIVGSARPGP